MTWLERWRRRQFEIAQGADADLFRSNARRYRWAAGLFASGAALALLATKLHLAHALHVVASTAAGLLLVAGAILARWAQAEGRFLRKPDPEGPPSILK
jgi:ribosomal protein S18 acetylase RimI-like enzyme